MTLDLGTICHRRGVVEHEGRIVLYRVDDGVVSAARLGDGQLDESEFTTELMRRIHDDVHGAGSIRD